MAEALTIVVCTRNRAARLDRMLDSLHRSMKHAPVQTPVVVVDNGSSDHTPKVLRAWSGTLSLRTLVEPRPGLSVARNRAVDEIDGGAIWFLDDDVLVGNEWVAAARGAAAAHPGADYIGGRILPRWEAAPPRWCPTGPTCPYRGMLVWYDAGDLAREWGPDLPPFFGANLMIRRRVFDAGLRFDSDLGRIDNRPRLGEEAALQEVLRRLGRSGRYAPEAVVHHPVPAERMRLRYLLGWHLESGRAAVRLAAQAGMPRCWHGIPRYVYRQGVTQLVAGAWRTASGAASLCSARAAHGLAGSARGLGILAEIAAGFGQRRSGRRAGTGHARDANIGAALASGGA